MRNLIPTMLLAAAALAGCGQEATTPSSTVDAADLPADQVVYNLQHTMTDEGIRTAVLHSDTAYLQEETEHFDLVGVRLQFYAESGRERGTLTANTGEYDVRGGIFVARGNAVLRVEGKDGMRELRAEELFYDLASGELWSDVPFVLNDEGKVTRGERFRSDANLQSWSVTGGRTEGGLPQPEEGISF